MTLNNTCFKVLLKKIFFLLISLILAQDQTYSSDLRELHAPHPKAFQTQPDSEVQRASNLSIIDDLVAPVNTFMPHFLSSHVARQIDYVCPADPYPQAYQLTNIDAHETAIFISSRLLNPKLGHILSALMKRLDEILAKDSFLFIQARSPLIPILNDHYEKMDTDDLLHHQSLVEPFYYALFDCELPNVTLQNTRNALTHLQTVWPLGGIYFESHSRETAIRKFFEAHGANLYTGIQKLRAFKGVSRNGLKAS